MPDAVTDTHRLIWYLEYSPYLGSDARAVFDACDRGESVIYVPTVCLVDIGYFNLWAEVMEVTQGVQPWLPITWQTLKSGAPPTFQYPAPPTAVPLVAGRTTAVRVYAAVEGTTGSQDFENVRAQLHCYANASYTIHCPGYQYVNPQSVPPDVLSQITVRPGDSLTTKRDDTKLSWVFIWSVVDWPDGSEVWFSNGERRVTRIFADQAGIYEVELNVHDGQTGAQPDRVTVYVTGPRAKLHCV